MKNTNPCYGWIHKPLAVITIMACLLAPAISRAGTIISDNYDGYANMAAFGANYNTITSLGLNGTGGIGGSQAITNTADISFFQLVNTLDLSKGPATASLLFKWNGAGTACPGLGFSTPANKTFTSSYDVGGRISNTPKLVVRANNADVATSGTAISSSMVTGNWYELVVTVTRTATLNTFNVVMTLYNSNSSGVRGSQIDTLSSSSAVSANIYAAASVVAGIREAKSGTIMDNFLVTQVPNTPANLIATPGGGQISLSWGAVTSAGTVTYNIKRSTSSGAETTLVAGVSAASYTDTGLTDGTTYYYVVSAVDSILGEGGNSTEANATPSSSTAPTPTGVTSLATNGLVTVSWNASAGAASYSVKRGTTSGVYTGTNSITAPATTFVDNVVVNGTTYYYAVSAVNVGGESADSIETSATPLSPPATPASLTATPGNYQVDLSWPASATVGANAATSYNIKRSGSTGTETNFASAATTSYTDITAISGVTYYYKVSPVSGSFGEGAATTEASATPTGVPMTITNLGAQAGMGYITLAWSAPLGTPLSYNIKKSTSSGAEILLTNITGTVFVDTNVVIGNPYYYKVSALNVSGEGSDSAETSSTPVGAPALKVRMPFDGTNTGMSYTAASDTSVAGTANITLVMTNYTGGTNIDLHGAANSGVQGFGRALDTSSRTAQGGGGSPGYVTYVKAAANLGLGTIPSWTASIWLKPSQTIGNNALDLFVIGAGGTAYAGQANAIGVRTLAPSQLAVRVNNGTDLLFNLSSSIPTNSWRFLALTYDGVNLMAYLGSETNSATLVGTTNIGAGSGSVAFGGTGTLFFGNNINTYNEVFAGWLDDFRFYGGPGDANFIESIRTSSFPPTAPAGLAAVPGDGQVDLNWSAVPSAVGYNVKRATSSGAEVTITNVTSASLTDLTVVNGTIYYYTVSALNGFFESPDSTEATVSPASGSTPPTVVVAPASTNVNCGSTVVLVAAATGSPPLAYQWYDCLDNPVVNETNQSLTLAGVNPAQSGNYTVIVTNDFGSATNACALTVVDTVPPVITLNGSSSMTNLLNYPFTDPGATANDTCDGPVAVNVSGSVDTGTPGSYTLTYTATDGVNSSTNTRTVTVVPNILVQLEFSTPGSTVPIPAGFTRITAATYAYGTNFTYANVAGSGYTLNFTNIRAYSANGATIDTDGFLFPTASAHQAGYGAFSTFNLTGLPTNVQVTAYACWGWNAGSAAANFTYAGMNSQLTVGTGIASPDTNALQNIGAMVADATGAVGGTFTGANGNVNVQGQIGGMIFKVETAAAPTATVNPAMAVVECSGSTNLTAAVTGAGPLTYQWYDINNQPISGATNATLVLTNLHTAQSGLYSVTVANPAGSVSATNMVVVVDTVAPAIICNSNLFLVIPTLATGTNVSFTVTATDGCDGSATVVSEPASGSFFPPGTNIVQSYAYDSSENTNMCSFQVVVHRAPTAADATYARAKGTSLKIAIADLLTNVLDPDAGMVALQSVGAGSTGASITSDSVYVYYLPGTGAGSNDNDSFSYTTIDDFGFTASASVHVNVYSASGPAQMSVPVNGVVNIKFFGIPNYTYVVQTTTNMSGPWWPLSTNTAGADGSWLFTDTNATNAQQYYRSAQP